MKEKSLFTRSLYASISAAAVLAILPTTLQAIPVDGGAITVAADGHVFATFIGKSPGTAYSDNLFLDSLASPFLFNNFSSIPGTTIDLGSFTAGTELVFRLHVDNTGDNFFSGDPARNADNVAHARVLDPVGGSTEVDWEDLYGDPEGASGFNDLFFSFTNVRAVGTPDTGSTLALLGIGVFGLVGFARRSSKQPLKQ